MVDDAGRPDEEVQDENPVIAHRISPPTRAADSWSRLVSPETAASTSEGNQAISRHFIRISAAAHGLVRTSRPGLGHTADMKTTVMNPVKGFTLFVLGLTIAAMGIYVADADDAPGAAVIGMLLMAVGVVLGVRAARNRLPMWATCTAPAVGVVVAAFAAFLNHRVVFYASLLPQ